MQPVSVVHALLLQTAQARVPSGRTRWLPQRLASALRCSVPVCLGCGASHGEALPRGRAIDAESAQQRCRRIWWLESEDLG